MEIEVFERISNFNYQSANVIDTFASLRNDRYYYKSNQFTLVVPITKVNVSLLVPETILLIAGTYYYVDKVTGDSEDENNLFVSGQSLFGKTEKRIVWRTYNKTTRPEIVAYEHLMNEVVNPSDSKRKLDYLTSQSPSNLTGMTIQYQNSYGVVKEEIESLCDAYDFGFKEVANSIVNPSSQVIFYRGRDLSNSIEFSADFENLLTESYENSNDDYATTAIVYGEGEGSNRQSIVINPNLTGIERREIYVDARDLQQEVDGVSMTNAQYLNVLGNRGIQRLAERQSVLRLDGDIDLNSKLFVFGKDYDIGDKVRLTSKRFQMTKVATLVGVEETWDSDGHHLSPIWDKETTTLLDKIKRK